MRVVDFKNKPMKNKGNKFKIFYYDSKDLLFRPVELKKLIPLVLIVTSLSYLIIYQLGMMNGVNTKLVNLPLEDKVHIVEMMRTDTFSREALAEMIDELNIKFPHIVMAQAIIESGHFESNIFRANQNLFGMREARARCTTAKGTELEHAYYDHWHESVYDYALFQSRYLHNLKTEDEYLNYLEKNYAEAENYDKAILRVIDNQNLRELFSK